MPLHQIQDLVHIFFHGCIWIEIINAFFYGSQTIQVYLESLRMIKDFSLYERNYIDHSLKFYTYLI